MGSQGVFKESGFYKFFLGGGGLMDYASKPARNQQRSKSCSLIDHSGSVLRNPPFVLFFFFLFPPSPSFFFFLFFFYSVYLVFCVCSVLGGR